MSSTAPTPPGTSRQGPTLDDNLGPQAEGEERPHCVLSTMAADLDRRPELRLKRGKAGARLRADRIRIPSEVSEVSLVWVLPDIPLPELLCCSCKRKSRPSLLPGALINFVQHIKA